MKKRRISKIGKLFLVNAAVCLLANLILILITRHFHSELLSTILFVPKAVFYIGMLAFILLAADTLTRGADALDEIMSEDKTASNPETDEVTEFIGRRFSEDCSWTTGNCYYFAVILKARFPEGNVFYDTIDGHFLFKRDGKYYDHEGVAVPDKEEAVIEWDKFKEYDENRYKAVVEGCIR